MPRESPPALVSRGASLAAAVLLRGVEHRQCTCPDGLPRVAASARPPWRCCRDVRRWPPTIPVSAATGSCCRALASRCIGLGPPVSGLGLRSRAPKVLVWGAPQASSRVLSAAPLRRSSSTSTRRRPPRVPGRGHGAPARPTGQVQRASPAVRKTGRPASLGIWFELPRVLGSGAPRAVLRALSSRALPRTFQPRLGVSAARNRPQGPASQGIGFSGS